MTGRDRFLRTAIAPLRWWPKTFRADDRAMVAAEAAGLVEGEPVSPACDADIKLKGPLKEWSLTPAGCALLNGPPVDLARVA